MVIDASAPPKLRVERWTRPEVPKHLASPRDWLESARRRCSPHNYVSTDLEPHLLEVHSAFHATREADWKPRGEYRVDRPDERATNEVRRPARSTVTAWSFLIHGAKMHFSRTQTAWNST